MQSYNHTGSPCNGRYASDAILTAHRIAHEAAQYLATHPAVPGSQLRPSFPDLGAHVLYTFLSTVLERNASAVALHYSDNAAVMGYRGLRVDGGAVGG